MIWTRLISEQRKLATFSPVCMCMNLRSATLRSLQTVSGDCLWSKTSIRE